MSKQVHVHKFTRRNQKSTVEICKCGRWRFTENAGPAIEEIAAIKCLPWRGLQGREWPHVSLFAGVPMTAESDYEKARAERKEVGFEPDGNAPAPPIVWDSTPVTGYETLCRRCRKPTEYQARWCYDCERAMFGED